MASISETRWKEMERIAKQDPNTRFSVIITLREGASGESLEKSGLRIEHRSFNIVSGDASFDVLKKLSATKEIELIEEDGEVHALDGSQ